MNNRLDQCGATCAECRAQCLRTVQVCLKQGGKLADAKLCLLLAECAQLCQVTADMAAAGSERLARVAAACAEHCDDCARACDAMNESPLQECAAMLRECAAECRSIQDPVGA